MPPKCSQMIRSRVAGGRSNSRRYHHDTRYGLSDGIGSSANWLPIGYVVPGMARRFIPVYGSGYRPLSTSAPTTVPGTDAACHPGAANPGREIASPCGLTFADD